MGKKKFRPERIMSKSNFGHATQQKTNRARFDVFFHVNRHMGKSITVANGVTKSVAQEMLEEMDETGADFSE